MSKLGIIDSTSRIITTNLVLYYDTTQFISYISGSSTIDDISGNRYSGSLLNGPSYNSENGGSISLDGTNDYISSVNNVNLGNLRDDQFTISLWTYINSISGNTMLVMLSSVALGDTGFYMQTNGVLSLYIASFNSFGSTGNNVYSTGTWQNLVVTYNRNVTPTTSFYVNNTKTTVTITTSRTFLGNSIPISIGGPTRSFVDNYLNGRISQVLIYGRALTDTEVAQNYNFTKARYRL